MPADMIQRQCTDFGSLDALYERIDEIDKNKLAEKLSQRSALKN